MLKKLPQGDLKAMVRQWILSEVAFRLGVRNPEGCSLGAGSFDLQEWYVEAEACVRRALTGQGDLLDAAEALGYKVGRQPWEKKMKKIKKAGKRPGTLLQSVDTIEL